MEKERLFRFFAGMASLEEGMEIRSWMEASEEHRRLFYEERKRFDAIMLHGTSGVQGPVIVAPRRKWGKLWMRIAAVVLLTLACEHLCRLIGTQEPSVAMTVVSVPAGQRTHLTLPDGTKVWLNARSVLQYPTRFNEYERTLRLQGEAYFDVAPNKQIPFIVQTEHYQVEALGTQFDVEAYPDQIIFETTLMQGGVKVSSLRMPDQSVMLKPGSKVRVENGTWQTEPVEDFSPYRWKEGLICFRDESFVDIMESFEKYYGVKIHIRNEKTLQHTYTGKFRQADGVDYALRVLQKDINFIYQKENDGQDIYIN